MTTTHNGMDIYNRLPIDLQSHVGKFYSKYDHYQHNKNTYKAKYLCKYTHRSTILPIDIQEMIDASVYRTYNMHSYRDMLDELNTHIETFPVYTMTSIGGKTYSFYTHIIVYPQFLNMVC